MRFVLVLSVGISSCQASNAGRAGSFFIRAACFGGSRAVIAVAARFAGIRSTMPRWRQELTGLSGDTEDLV